jgi:hypothetical protein
MLVLLLLMQTHHKKVSEKSTLLNHSKIMMPSLKLSQIVPIQNLISLQLSKKISRQKMASLKVENLAVQTKDQMFLLQKVQKVEILSRKHQLLLQN